MSHQKFVRDVSIMGFTQALTSLGGFLLLPLLTKSLGSYDYGTWTQINVTVSLLTPLALMGLTMGFVRFLSSEKDSEVIKEGVYSILFFVGFTGAILSLLIFVSSNVIAQWAFSDISTSYFIKIGSFLIFINVLDQVALFYFRVFQKIKMFSALLLFQAFGKLLIIGILLHFGYGLLGAIIGILIEQIILFGIAFPIVVSEIGFKVPKFLYIKDYLKFSLPMAPNGVIRWVTDSSDRYLLGYFLGLGSVGIYTASYSIGSLIKMLVTPIQQILFPELSRLYDEGDFDSVKIYLSYSMKYFLLLTIPATVGLTVLAKPLLTILTTTEFIEGWYVVPFVAISGILAGVFQIMINITTLIKQTKFNFYVHLIAACSNIILNIFLIPYIGIVGAAISTLFSYLLMITGCMWISYRYLKFKIDHITTAKSVVASLMMGGLIILIDPAGTTEILLCITSGALFYFMQMYALKTFSKHEKMLFKNLFYK